MEYIFTNHAVEKFTKLAKRFSQLGSDPLKQLHELIDKAEEDKNIHPTRRIKRLISNNFEEAQYLVYQDWRFIVVKDTVKTVERTKRWQND